MGEEIKSDMAGEDIPEEMSLEEKQGSAEDESIPAESEPVGEAKEEKGKRSPTVAERVKARARAVSPPRSRSQERKYVTKGVFAGWSILLFFLSVLLGAILALGVIFLYNSTLLYAPQHDFAELTGQVAQLQGAKENLEYRVKTLQEDAESLQDRVRELETLPGQVEALRAQVDRIVAEVDAVTAKTERLESEMTQLQEQVEALSEQTEKFDRFLSALRDLLVEIQGSSQ